jgi:cell division septation protein DedD
LKTRLLGAFVLFALAVLFLPMIFNGKSPTTGGDQAVSLAIPPSPEQDLQTRTMSLTPEASAPAASTPTPAGSSRPATSTVVAPATGDQLATVNIASSRPRDVETDPQAGKPPLPTTVTTGTRAAPAQPMIPMQTKPVAASPVVSSKPAAAHPLDQSRAAVPAMAASVEAAPAADESGSFTLNLSAYANAAGAAGLQRRVHALGYPVNGYPITQAGQARTLVIAGPFHSRTAAEAARLKITQSIPGTPARLEQGASRAVSTDAAPSSAGVAPKASTRAGGWAVQLAAMSAQAEANALRDKLRSQGFDGFVDSVQAGGKTLWRVRAGPQTQRADAQRIHDQIKASLGIDGNVVPVP